MSVYRYLRILSYRVDNISVLSHVIEVLRIWLVTTNMDVVDEICDLLQLHANRDKVSNLTCYTLKFLGSTYERKELMTASTRLALTRSTLRLFDDAAALKVTLSYGIGKQDGLIWGPIGVAGNLFTLAYLQAEKVGWLIDTGLLKVSEDTEYKVKTSHKLFWSLYAFVGLLKSIRALHSSAQLLKSPHRPKCAPARFNLASLTTTKLLLDVIHVVSWLPRGWLWGSALKTQHASGIAMMAAFLGLVVHFNGKKFLPQK